MNTNNKKLRVVMIGILILSLLFSATTYAAEIQGSTIAVATEDSAIETEQKENLTSTLYTREKGEVEDVLTKSSDEEWEISDEEYTDTDEDKGENEGIAFVVLQLKKEKDDLEEDSQETDTTEETGKLEEAQEALKVSAEKILLTEKHLNYIEKVSKIHAETVVIYNGFSPEDYLCLEEYSNVIGKVIKVELGEAELEEKLLNLDIDKARTKYHEKLEKVKAAKEQADMNSTVDLGGQDANASYSTSNTTEPKAKSNTDATVTPTGGASSTNKVARTGSSATSTPTPKPTSTSSPTTSEDVTITLAFDEEIAANYDATSATCKISSRENITSGKITITYDADKIQLDESDIGANLTDSGMTSKIQDVNDGFDEDGKIVLEFNSTTGVQLEGDLLDLYFYLDPTAQEGDTYELKIEVNEMKNGNKILKHKAEGATMTVPKETVEPTATPASTKPTSIPTGGSSSNGSTSGKTTSAPKTGDDNMMSLWIILGAVSAMSVLYMYGKKRKTSK